MIQIIDFNLKIRINVSEPKADHMTVLVIILISAPLLIFLLAAPIILIVDTETDEYCIRLGDLCSVRALTALENPGVRVRIGFWKKTWVH